VYGEFFHSAAGGDGSASRKQTLLKKQLQLFDDCARNLQRACHKHGNTVL